MSADDVACTPVSQCRQLLVELPAVRLRVTALEQAVADDVRRAERDERIRCLETAALTADSRTAASDATRPTWSAAR